MSFILPARQMLLRLLALFLFFPLGANSAIRIDSKYVRSRVLEHNLSVKENALSTEESILNLAIARSVYDWQTKLFYRYRNEQGRTLNNFFYDRSKIGSFGFALKKKSFLGTSFSWEFSRMHQKAEPSSEFSIPLSENRYEFSAELKLRQSLLRNAFGTGDRYNIASAKKSLDISKLKQKQNLEKLLAKGLKLYWNAYTSQQIVFTRESIKNEYIRLKRVLEKKNSLGFNDQVDVEKVQAEFLNQNRELNYAKTAYQEAKIELMRFLQLSPGEEIFLKPNKNNTIPPLPEREEFSNLDWKNSYAVKIREKEILRAKLRKKAIYSMTRPSLDLVAAYRSLSLADTAKDSFRQFRSRENPNYSIGIEFNWNFWSKENKAKRSYEEIRLQEADLAFQKEKERKRDEVKKVWLVAEKYYQIVIDSKEELKVRNSIIERQKRSFQQGRLDTSQLILDYNAFFFAQLRHIQAVRIYNFALLELQLTFNKLL